MSVILRTILAAHYHPEAPGTPWVGSPVLEVPQDNLGAPQASPSIRVPTPASSGNHQAPFAADADHIRSSHERPAGSAILLSEQAPASLATADVIDDPVESASHGREGSQLSGRRDSTSTSMGQRWPSASEMSPEMLREYLATMEIPKPKPRPRRKHLDRKKELIRMKKELEDILIHRTALLKLEEARNVPPGAQIAADRLLQMHGLELRANQQYDVNTEEEGGHEVDSSRLSRPMSAQSTFQSESSQISPINSKDVNMHAIEEEIIDLNNEIERLMVSISELDKIKDPQIELSFTGPKTKNMQRARLDDELWTDITGRAPGIVRLQSFPS